MLLIISKGPFYMNILSRCILGSMTMLFLQSAEKNIMKSYENKAEIIAHLQKNKQTIIQQCFSSLTNTSICNVRKIKDNYIFTDTHNHPAVFYTTEGHYITSMPAFEAERIDTDNIHLINNNLIIWLQDNITDDNNKYCLFIHDNKNQTTNKIMLPVIGCTLAHIIPSPDNNYAAIFCTRKIPTTANSSLLRHGIKLSSNTLSSVHLFNIKTLQFEGNGYQLDTDANKQELFNSMPVIWNAEGTKVWLANKKSNKLYIQELALSSDGFVKYPASDEIIPSNITNICINPKTGIGLLYNSIKTILLSTGSKNEFIEGINPQDYSRLYITSIDTQHSYDIDFNMRDHIIFYVQWLSSDRFMIVAGQTQKNGYEIFDCVLASDSTLAIKTYYLPYTQVFQKLVIDLTGNYLFIIGNKVPGTHHYHVSMYQLINDTYHQIFTHFCNPLLCTWNTTDRKLIYYSNQHAQKIVSFDLHLYENLLSALQI